MTIFVCLLLLLLPISLHYLSHFLREAFPESTSDADNTIYIEITPKYDLEDIKRSAIERAANGDAAARNWVMKYVYNTTNSPKAPAASLTSQNIVNDAITALVSLGTKKKDATDKINSLVANKKYNSVHQLLNEAFKK